MGETKTCTITNNDQAASLIINKAVVNDNGGSLTAEAFSGTVGGVTAAGGQTWTGASTTLTLTSVGSYSVTENAHPGYDATFSADCTGAIALGQTRTCTVTNDDQVPHLIVNKVVVNNNGGFLTAAAFSGTIGGAVVAAGGNTWSGASTDMTLTAVGSYSVAENAHPGYDATFSAGCSGTIALGETRICTVTNDDQAAHLTLIKHVVNGNGGSASAGAFTLTASGAAVPGGSMLVPGTEAPGVTIEVNAGYYIVTENSVSGYTQTGAVGCEGTLTNGGSATCTVVNSDQKSDPGIQTTMSWRLIDSAAFTNFRTGAGQSAADATIVFNLYGPSAAKSCVGQGQGANLIYTETITGVATAGPYPTQTGWVVTVPGTYRWIATYSGDSFNNGKATQCGDETHTITVGEPPATPLAQFITPVNGATDVNATQPIQWTAVDGAQAYYLYVGTSVGAKDLVNTGEVQTTTYSAAGLLPAGQLLYARIWTKESSIWRYSDITFTVSSGGTTLRATVIAPVNGATGVNPAGTIQWTSVPNAQKYYVYVGSTPGALDLIDSQEICNGCVNSPMVTSWSMANAGKSPAQGLGGKAGQTVYLRLWTMVAGVWRFVDSSFTVAP